MRLFCIGLLVLATGMLQACTSADPAELTGTPILKRRTDHSKAIRADDDDDDDDNGGSTTTKKRPAAASSGATATESATSDDGPTFVPSGNASSTDTGTGTGTSTAPAAKSVEEQCYEIINKYRAKTGLPALARWTNNETCSDTESQNDSQSGAAHGSFGQCGEMAQNECPGYPSSAEQNLPECLADMYAEGPGGGHYENMTSQQYTMVSCGVFEVGDGTFWSVQNFR